jgi:hypothetical protein
MNEFETKQIELGQQKAFEQKLTQTLRRVDAPEGFAARMIARAEAESVSSKVIVMVPRRRVWMSGAAAAALLVAAFAGQQEYQRHERATLATQQFETATRITEQTLERTREKLARAGVPLN